MRWRYSRRAGPALKGEFRRAPAWVSRLSVQRPVLQFGFRSGYLSICLRCLLSWVLSKQVEITCVLFFPFVCCFGLLCLLVMRESLLVFHCCTARNLAGCYAENCERLKNRGLHGSDGWVLGWRPTQTPYNLDPRFGLPPSTSLRTGAARAPYQSF